MNIVEKYLSAAKLKDEPKKKLSLKIKDGSITMDKLSKDLRTFINTGKTVRIDELDTMTDVKHAMTDAPSVYTVINNLPITTTTVGLLVMFSDSLGHCITQLLFTHYIVRDGVLQIGEHDHRLHIYTRNYVLRSPQEGETVNEWTKWFVINKGTLTHMSQYYKSLPYSTIEAREDTIDSAIGKLEGGYASLNTGKQNALKAYSENGQVGRNATAGIYAGEITFTTVGKDGQYDMSIPTMHLQNGKAYYGTSIDDGSEIATKASINGKQDKINAGNGIDINGNTISVLADTIAGYGLVANADNTLSVNTDEVASKNDIVKEAEIARSAESKTITEILYLGTSLYMLGQESSDTNELIDKTIILSVGESRQISLNNYQTANSYVSNNGVSIEPVENGFVVRGVAEGEGMVYAVDNSGEMTPFPVIIRNKKYIGSISGVANTSTIYSKTAVDNKIKALEDEIAKLKEQINNTGGGNGYSIIEDDDQNPTTV